MKRFRDGQKNRVYDSERDFGVRYYGTTTAAPFPAATLDEEAAEKFVLKVIHSAWWRKRFGSRDKFTVQFTNRRCAGWGAHYRVFLPAWMRFDVLILHELAHTSHSNLLTCRFDTHPHDRNFCYRYLQLLRRWAGKTRVEGKAIATLLTTCFREHGVRYLPSRHRKLNAAQLAALRRGQEALRARLAAKAAALPPPASV